ncbi:MAG: YqeG family HAD IIIA-type phosphatase [Atopobiaceae bacterium]|nr:YqeG family HAD IIIA-type phosphatase [Atopobiaceae bacterium]
MAASSGIPGLLGRAIGAVERFVYAPVRADRNVARVELIDLDDLKAQGIRAILFDRDNTVVPRDSKVAPPEVQAWLDRAREMGFLVYMVSNNWHTSEVQRTAAELGCKGIDHALKPLPFTTMHALKKLGVSPDRAVLIGDQLFTDILGGNLAGCRTILVHQQCDVDIFGMAPVRAMERFINRGIVFEGDE